MEIIYKNKKYSIKEATSKIFNLIDNQEIVVTAFFEAIMNVENVYDSFEKYEKTQNQLNKNNDSEV